MARSNNFFITPNLQANKACSSYFKTMDPTKVKKEGMKGEGRWGIDFQWKALLINDQLSNSNSPNKFKMKKNFQWSPKIMNIFKFIFLKIN